MLFGFGICTSFQCSSVLVFVRVCNALRVSMLDELPMLFSFNALWVFNALQFQCFMSFQCSMSYQFWYLYELPMLFSFSICTSFQCSSVFVFVRVFQSSEKNPHTLWTAYLSHSLASVAPGNCLLATAFSLELKVRPLSGCEWTSLLFGPPVQLWQSVACRDWTPCPIMTGREYCLCQKRTLLFFGFPYSSLAIVISTALYCIPLMLELNFVRTRPLQH